MRVRVRGEGEGKRQSRRLTSSSDWSKKSLLFLMILMHTSSPECRSTHRIALEKAALPRYSRTW